MFLAIDTKTTIVSKSWFYCNLNRSSSVKYAKIFTLICWAVPTDFIFMTEDLHLLLNFMGMFGKWFSDAGLKAFLLETGVAAESSHAY